MYRKSPTRAHHVDTFKNSPFPEGEYRISRRFISRIYDNIYRLAIQREGGPKKKNRIRAEVFSPLFLRRPGPLAARLTTTLFWATLTCAAEKNREIARPELCGRRNVDRRELLLGRNEGFLKVSTCNTTNSRSHRSLILYMGEW